MIPFLLLFDDETSQENTLNLCSHASRSENGTQICTSPPSSCFSYCLVMNTIKVACYYHHKEMEID